MIRNALIGFSLVGAISFQIQLPNKNTSQQPSRLLYCESHKEELTDTYTKCDIDGQVYYCNYEQCVSHMDYETSWFSEIENIHPGFTCNPYLVDHGYHCKHEGKDYKCFKNTCVPI